MIDQKYTFFYNGVFSQWYMCNFIVDGIEYNCAEQYMMYQKVLLFNDIDSSLKIINSKSPKEQKELGRNIVNFNDTIWVENRVKIVYTGNYYKFTQHEDLLKKLLNTEGTILVEASKMDTIWGIGMYANDSRIFDNKKWKGLNLLGYTLTKLRQDLLKEIKNGEEFNILIENDRTM